MSREPQKPGRAIPARRRRDTLSDWLLYASVVGLGCFASIITYDLIENWRAEEYYASLTAVFDGQEAAHTEHTERAEHKAHTARTEPPLPAPSLPKPIAMPFMPMPPDTAKWIQAAEETEIGLGETARTLLDMWKALVWESHEHLRPLEALKALAASLPVPDASAGELWGRFAAYAGGYKAARESAMDFRLVREEAPDAMAWIRLEGTKINYPVMYGTDNEFYLEHLPNGQKSKTGSLFIDFRNAPDFSDQNTLIHGHRMKSGAMFGELKNYVSQSFYDKHPTVSIFTPEGDYEVQLFAAYAFDQTAETPPVKFRDAESFERYVSSAKRRSLFKSGVEPAPGDRLVTMSTCEYSFSNGRLIVVGKLVN